jgi:hypothetical protein
MAQRWSPNHIESQRDRLVDRDKLSFHTLVRWLARELCGTREQSRLPSFG